MKYYLTIVVLFLSLTIQAQENELITQVNFAGELIPVPEDCSTDSEYALVDCQGTSVQWLYLNEQMLGEVVEQYTNQIGAQPGVENIGPITILTFGSELKGDTFERKYAEGVSYNILASGIVNDQPLLLNIVSDTEIKGTDDLSVFLKSFIEIE